MHVIQKLKLGFWRPGILCWLAVLFVLGVVAVDWNHTTGLTTLLRFGDQFASQRLPELNGVPLRTYPGVGYDGQFYSQLAVNPDVRQPAVQHMLDNPRYRSRRILVSAVVHFLSGGSPWLALQLFAFVNVAVWLLLGWRLWLRLSDAGWQGAGAWLGCMLGIGALDSVRLSLTDLPAMLLIFLATEAAVRNRPRTATLIMAAGVLARDTSLLTAALPATGHLRSMPNWIRHVGTVALIALPLALWSAWIAWYVPVGDPVGTGHFSVPGISLGRNLLTCARELAAGNFDSRYLFGLLAGVSFTWQAVYLLRLTSDNPSPWLRIGLPYAVFYFLIGDAVWKGYWAVGRTCLPMAFAYNLMLVRRPKFWWHLVLGNLCVLHAVYRLLPD